MDMKNIIFFLGGVVLGSVTTYLIVKDKYEEQMNSETEQIKTYYENKYKVEEEPEEEKKEEIVEERIVEEKDEPDYQGIIQGLNYNQFSTKVGDKPAKRPYLISMDDYNTDTKYIKKIVSLFEDDEVCMDNDTKEVMDNVAKDIGIDNLEYIAQNGDSEIYVRNDQLGIDYNIVSEPGSYEDFIEVGSDE